MNRTGVILAVVSITIAHSNTTEAGMLLGDNFNDNSLDGSIWSTNTAALGSAVVEQNQRIEITERGNLYTTTQYDPLVVGPMTITGRWTLQTSGDILDVITRSDPNDLSTVAFPNNGITFQYNENTAVPVINISRISNGAFTLLTQTQINFAPGEVFDFTITDDGTNVAFSVVEVGGGGKSASISSTDSTDFATDHVVFTNSRFGNFTAYLDNVQISSVPEPSSIALLITGGLCLIGFRRRRKDAA